MSKLSGNGFVFFFEQSHTHTVTRSSVELKKKTFHCRFTVYLYRPVCGPVWTITFESNSIKKLIPHLRQPDLVSFYRSSRLDQRRRFIWAAHVIEAPARAASTCPLSTVG